MIVIEIILAIVMIYIFAKHKKKYTAKMASAEEYLTLKQQEGDLYCYTKKQEGERYCNTKKQEADSYYQKQTTIKEQN